MAAAHKGPIPETDPVVAGAAAELEAEPEPEPVDDMHPADRARMNAVDDRLAQQFLRSTLAKSAPTERDHAQASRRLVALLRRIAEIDRERELVMSLSIDDQISRLPGLDARWRAAMAAVDSELALSDNTNT